MSTALQRRELWKKVHSSHLRQHFSTDVHKCKRCMCVCVYVCVCVCVCVCASFALWGPVERSLTKSALPSKEKQPPELRLSSISSIFTHSLTRVAAFTHSHV